GSSNVRNFVPRTKQEIIRPMKSTSVSLHQFPSQPIQRLLGCEPANSRAVAWKIPFYNVRSGFTGERLEDQSHRFFCRSSGRACNSGHTQPQRRSTALSYALGQRARNLLADRAVNINQILRNIGELSLE